MRTRVSGSLRPVQASGGLDRLGQHADPGRHQRDLAPAAGGDLAGDLDQVTPVDEPIDVLERQRPRGGVGGAQQAGVDEGLELAGGVLEVEEHELAVAPAGHEPAGEGGGGALQLA